MPTYELPTAGSEKGYKIEKKEVRLATLGEATFQALDHDRKIASDEAHTAKLFNEYLMSFFAEYSRANNKGEVLDPEKLVATDLSYDREDLLKFRESVHNIILLLDAVNEASKLPKYTEYTRKFRDVLLETEKKLNKIEVKKNSESEQLAA